MKRLRITLSLLTLTAALDLEFGHGTVLLLDNRNMLKRQILGLHLIQEDFIFQVVCVEIIDKEHLVNV